MGQYRQWLHYRGIDQLLRSQLAVSEHELEQLQAQVEVLGKQFFSSENAIFRMLLDTRSAQQNNTGPLKEQISRSAEEDIAEIATTRRKEEKIVEDEIIIEEVQDIDTATISPALFAWSRLPNFDTQIIQEPDATNSSLPVEPSATQSHEQLLPTDIGSFVDAYYPTNPQIKIPWWLRRVALNQQSEAETQLADRPGEHADYLVKRWFERWGQHSTQTERAQEDQIYEPGN